MLNNIMGGICISLLQDMQTQVYWMDGDIMAGDNALGYLYAEATAASPNFKLAQSEADMLRFINEIYEAYVQRKKIPSAKNIFIAISNMQWLDIINKIFKHENIEEDLILGNERDAVPSENGDSFDFTGDYSFQKNGADYKLLKLIDDGASSGIYFVVSSNECNHIKETMYMGENVLSKFPFRIIFSLNDNDADYLINNVSLASLRDNIVYFTDSVKSTFQFKPFLIPSASEIGLLNNILHRRN
jgi:hypothetical protein